MQKYKYTLAQRRMMERRGKEKKCARNRKTSSTEEKEARPVGSFSEVSVSIPSATSRKLTGCGPDERSVLVQTSTASLKQTDVIDCQNLEALPEEEPVDGPSNKKIAATQTTTWLNSESSTWVTTSRSDISKIDLDAAESLCDMSSLFTKSLEVVDTPPCNISPLFNSLDHKTEHSTRTSVMSLPVSVTRLSEDSNCAISPLFHLTRELEINELAAKPQQLTKKEESDCAISPLFQLSDKKELTQQPAESEIDCTVSTLFRLKQVEENKESPVEISDVKITQESDCAISPLFQFTDKKDDTFGPEPLKGPQESDCAISPLFQLSDKQELTQRPAGSDIDFRKESTLFRFRELAEITDSEIDCTVSTLFRLHQAEENKVQQPAGSEVDCTISTLFRRSEEIDAEEKIPVEAELKKREESECAISPLFQFTEREQKDVKLKPIDPKLVAALYKEFMEGPKETKNKPVESEVDCTISTLHRLTEEQKKGESVNNDETGSQMKLSVDSNCAISPLFDFNDENKENVPIINNKSSVETLSTVIPSYLFERPPTDRDSSTTSETSLENTYKGLEHKKVDGVSIYSMDIGNEIGESSWEQTESFRLVSNNTAQDGCLSSTCCRTTAESIPSLPSLVFPRDSWENVNCPRLPGAQEHHTGKMPYEIQAKDSLEVIDCPKLKDDKSIYGSDSSHSDDCERMHSPPPKVLRKRKSRKRNKNHQSTSSSSSVVTTLTIGTETEQERLVALQDRISRMEFMADELRRQVDDRIQCIRNIKEQIGRHVPDKSD